MCTSGQVQWGDIAGWEWGWWLCGRVARWLEFLSHLQFDLLPNTSRVFVTAPKVRSYTTCRLAGVVVSACSPSQKIRASHTPAGHLNIRKERIHKQWPRQAKRLRYLHKSIHTLPDHLLRPLPLLIRVFVAMLLTVFRACFQRQAWCGGRCRRSGLGGRCRIPGH